MRTENAGGVQHTPLEQLNEPQALSRSSSTGLLEVDADTSGLVEQAVHLANSSQHNNEETSVYQRITQAVALVDHYGQRTFERLQNDLKSIDQIATELGQSHPTPAFVLSVGCTLVGTAALCFLNPVGLPIYAAGLYGYTKSTLPFALAHFGQYANQDRGR